VLIGASAGTPVRAVYPGTVVYADRLRGFGQVMILDHGAGYLTVYAHGEALFRTVGELVRAGEEIARVGMDADNPEGGLYFEIRASGQPVDPVKWLSRGSSDTSSG
jgi:septal ring factor EnvC (AmiA/AmiB activator)